MDFSKQRVTVIPECWRIKVPEPTDDNVDAMAFILATPGRELAG